MVFIDEEIKNAAGMFNAENFLNFYQQMIKEFHSLLTEIKEGAYDHSGLTGGHEVEGNFLDKADFTIPPASKFEEGVFGKIKSELKENGGIISGELGDFNFELNTEPKMISGSFFSDEEREINRKLRLVEEAASRHGLTTYLSGLIETSREEDISLDNLIKHPSKHKRYLGINHGVRSFRESPFEISINNGHAHYYQQLEHIMIESICTSLQSHIKLEKPERDFSAYMNSALILAAPLVAISANSPFVNGRGPFWRESRVRIFEQSIDYRTPSERTYGINHNSFPERYYDSLEQFYTETLLNRLLLPDLSFGKNAGGENEIKYPLFRLQLGTDWRWARPVWFSSGESDGKRPQYMTLEFRPLPAGPTVPDMMANSALYLGALKYCTDNSLSEKFRREIDFQKIRNNFYAAAQFGLESQLEWLDGQIGAREVVEKCLEMARTGLKSFEINEEESDKYLGIIERRLILGQSPSDYKIETYKKTREAVHATEREALEAVVGISNYALHKNIPLLDNR